jgi:hypothetical protein
MLYLKSNQNVTLTFSPLDNAGNPIAIVNIPTWDATGPAILTLTPNEDGRNCLAQSNGSMGTVKVHVYAQANMGDGVKTITDFIDIEVQDGTYVPFSITVGTIQTSTVS